MEKRDARKLTQVAQYELKRTCIKLLKSGRRQGDAAKILDVARPTANRWWQAYQSGGMATLKPARRGRREGEKRTLPPKQEREIKQMILDKYPEQSKLKFALWNRQAVLELIADKVQHSMPIRTVGEYLSRCVAIYRWHQKYFFVSYHINLMVTNKSERELIWQQSTY